MNFTVNNNGDSFEDLLERYMDASKALGAMERGLIGIKPHARNYQTHPEPSYALGEDMAAYTEAVEALKVVNRFLHAYSERLATQIST
jgi:hypothetical protein